MPTYMLARLSWIFAVCHSEALFAEESSLLKIYPLKHCLFDRKGWITSSAGFCLLVMTVHSARLVENVALYFVTQKAIF